MTIEPMISIGLPVYNGKKFIQKRLDSILNQTITNFELIISDNASTDSTSDICKEYLQRDKRIRYIHQEKNMGAWWNFNFVLQQAKGKYFAWAAVDDIFFPDFLEKNVEALESNKNLICSTGKSQLYQLGDKKDKNLDNSFRGFRKKVIKAFRPSQASSLRGQYDAKVRTLLKKSAYQVIYGLFRTEVLKRGMIKELFVGNDGALLLKILQEGDVHLVDKVLIRRFEEGGSTLGSYENAKNFNAGFVGLAFPHYPFTRWFIKNLGIGLFFKNFDHFLLLAIGGEILLVMDLIRLMMKKT